MTTDGRIKNSVCVKENVFLKVSTQWPKYETDSHEGNVGNGYNGLSFILIMTVFFKS